MIGLVGNGDRPSAVALIMAVVIKMALYPVIHTQRRLRELKRMELRLATR